MSEHFTNYELGKPSIHLGGGNQLLYGIMGKRWDTAFKDNIWYGTNHWTRPLDEETPKNKNLVENGLLLKPLSAMKKFN